MGRLILIRHCETESNVEGTVQGRRDTPLSARGRHQAQLVGEHLKQSYTIDKIVTSDRTRAIETAKAICEPLTVTPLLRELDFGDWEGEKWSKVASDYPDDIEGLINSNPTFKPPNGDSLASLNERVDELINEYDLRTSLATTAIVSHDGTLRSIISNMLGWELKNSANLTLFVGSISVISFVNTKPSLELLNQYDHLNPSYESGRPE
jgi:broad specificity phosphatase PhoE